MTAPTAPPADPPTTRPDYAVPPGTYRALAKHRTSYARLFDIWCADIALLAATLVGISALVTKLPVRYLCPPECGRPPMGAPVTTNPRFTAPGGEFSVSYPTERRAGQTPTARLPVTLRADGR
jgi:hypothetical protein